jgi:hypothetical protein
LNFISYIRAPFVKCCLLCGVGEGGPGHVGNNVRGAVDQSDVRGLHERVDEDHFEDAFVLRVGYVLADFGRYNFVFTGHFALRATWPHRAPKRGEKPANECAGQGLRCAG